MYRKGIDLYRIDFLYHKLYYEGLYFHPLWEILCSASNPASHEVKSSLTSMHEMYMKTPWSIVLRSKGVYLDFFLFNFVRHVQLNIFSFFFFIGLEWIMYYFGFFFNAQISVSLSITLNMWLWKEIVSNFFFSFLSSGVKIYWRCLPEKARV